MGDLKLFRIAAGDALELKAAPVALEKSLQTVIEDNMMVMFGVRLLASEYSTGPKHGGRIDSLGIDETGSPVIFEYKRAVNESVINQGLFYLDWLVDHKAEFQLLAMHKLGNDVANDLDWTNPRVVCVANNFTKYDEHAVQQMGRSIELVRYRDFEGELLSFELVTAAKQLPIIAAQQSVSPAKKSPAPSKTVVDYLDQASPALKTLFAGLEAFIEALGDDVTKKALKLYFAWRRIKNFACVEVHPQSHALLIYLKVDPDSLTLEPGFSRDVRAIGHFGTGDLELRVKSQADLARALPLVQISYETS